MNILPTSKGENKNSLDYKADIFLLIRKCIILTSHFKYNTYFTL